MPLVPSWRSSHSAPSDKPAWRNSRCSVGSVIVRQHRPLGIGENHRESRARDLLVQALHFRARHRQQLAHALLQFLDGLRIEHGVLPRGRRLDAVFPQAPMPGAGDMRLDSGGLKAALHHMNDARRVARCEIAGSS